jgi:short-subunit dehydrogenase
VLHHKVINLSGRCGILTGATSGVGRALARLLAERGVRLVISGRRESRLNDLASEYPGVLIPLSGDITNSKFQEELVGKAEAAFGGIDLVIAAAGAGAVGSFSESSLDTMRRVFEIDFFAPVELVYKSLPQLKNGHAPAVVLIGSILGVHPLPLHGGYAAAKAALHGFARAVRPELASLGIDVNLAILGPTESEFWNNLVAGERASWSQGRSLPAKTTAAAIIAALERGSPAVIPGWRAKTYVLLSRFFPVLIDFFVRWKRRLSRQS